MQRKTKLSLKLYDQIHRSDLHTNIPLVDEDKEALVQMLKNDYVYAPYDIVKAKETLKDKFQYFIET